MFSFKGEGTDGDDYLAVGIQDGYLWFHFDVGSGKYSHSLCLSLSELATLF